ncbi:MULTISPECIES: family 20 glycosylhydrolase [Barnesiella]|uniref:glycoside hydrolase family 20 protein n=1 Tax=Barnesiella TaxID=397864 RepID=UPI00202FD034|nr:family 20 glycosylhydrolase [Barnesiella sp. B2-R-119]MCM0687185.1 family 20 glycosylhydrolase [Barnesiella sp. B2-R-119]
MNTHNIFKSVLFSTLLLIGNSCSERKEIDVIPMPRSVEYHSGNFTISPETKFYTNLSAESRQALTDYLEGTSLGSVPFAESATGNNGIELNLCDSSIVTGNEAYRIEIDKKGVRLSANTETGIFYGLQTLLQLLNNGDNKTLPALTINDSPRFPYRGLHLDVSRHFFDKEFVKKQLNAMAYFKMNRLHWHLTDGAGWRIEIKKYPRLTSFAAWRPFDKLNDWWVGGRTFCEQDDPRAVGGYYTQDDIREVVAYAAERHITIIPEIEMPGHSEEVLATYPELSCSGKPYVNADFCIGTEKTFEFLENVLLEVIDLFPSEYIHIGGDEASKSSWKTCPRCQKRMADEHLNSVDELQSYMIHRIEKFLNDHGRKIIGWDEIIEGGLSPTATVMSWRGEEGGIKAVKAGNQAIMTPGKYCYLDAFQDAPNTQPMAIGGYLTLEKVYSFEPVPDSLSTKEAELILGVQGNVWTEHIPTPEHYEYMIYPRILALAEIGWSPSEVKKWDNFHTRALQAVNILREQGYNPFPLEKEIGDKPESYQKVNHLAIGKKVSYANPYSNHYAAQGEKTLVDGVRGGWMYNDDRWQGFIDCDFDVTIDLGKETDIKQVCAEFIQLKGPYVWLPKQVIISSSVDGEHYDTLATIDNDISPDIETLQFKEFGWEGNAKARYIRYKALSNGIAGGWLFTDEIRIK